MGKDVTKDKDERIKILYWKVQTLSELNDFAIRFNRLTVDEIGEIIEKLNKVLLEEPKKWVKNKKTGEWENI